MDKYERQEYAVKRKIERERTIDALMAQAPKRKAKGSEFAELIDAIATAHALLHIYDNMENPPALAGVCESIFDAATARLGELIQVAAAAA
jgi:hypothetical protein